MFIIYKTTNTSNGKIYIGLHSCDNDCLRSKDGFCEYLGSGTAITKAIKKYGKESFKREILHQFDNLQDAIKKEKDLVTEDFIAQDTNYNLTVGGGIPPNQTGFSMPEHARAKISSASKSRSKQLSETAKRTMRTRSDNGGWTDEEVKKRVATRKKLDNYDRKMAQCNTEEAIRKRVATRKSLGQYDNVKTEQLKSEEVVFKRTRTRLINLIKKGRVISEITLSKYQITKSDFA